MSKSMILNQIREARISKSISQIDLAHKAQVSLATVQNLEAGRANPALETIEKLAHVLGLDISVKMKNIDWNLLAQTGVPLITSGQLSSFQPTPELLFRALENINVDSPELSSKNRSVAALWSFLCAIKDHYPSYWQRINTNLKDWCHKNSFENDTIKLRRLSLERLGKYL